MIPNSILRTRVSALSVLLLIAALAGCASHAPRRRVGVNIDRRPTPVQPDTAAVPVRSQGPKTVVMTPQTLRNSLASIAADTTEARSALNRCAGKTLLPDQEGVFDSTTRLLIEVREAMVMGDFPLAESRARQARQLAASIGCR